MHSVSNGVWCVSVCLCTFVHIVSIAMDASNPALGPWRGRSRTRLPQSSRYHRCRDDRRRGFPTFWCQDGDSNVKSFIHCEIVCSLQLIFVCSPQKSKSHDEDVKPDAAHVKVFRAEEIKNHQRVGLTKEGLILCALLCGGDYDKVSFGNRFPKTIDKNT